MNRAIFLGLFGLLILSSVSSAEAPIDPQQRWMMTMYDHTSCAIGFTATSRGNLLSRAYDYGDTMGYTPEQLAEFTDLAATLDAHDLQLFTYMTNNQYLPFLAELVATNTDLVTAKQMYGTTMKQYVRGDYSRINDVISDYSRAHSAYMSCISHEEPV